MAEHVPTIMWGGFTDDKLDVRKTDSGFGGWGNNFPEQPAIFMSRKDARREYEDVRPLRIELNK